jgi:transposase InsO family protein
MPLKVMDIGEQRLAVLEEPGWSGRSVREVCARHGISPDTFYAWRRRYAKAGLEGLVARSRRPKTSPGQLPAEVDDRIFRLRKEHGWGPRKIRDALRAEGLVVPAVSTVQEALARRGVLTARRRRAPARCPGTRFVREASNQLWQIDGTQHHLADGSPYWVVDLLDDHSRFCLDARVGRALTGQLAWTAFRTAVSRYGLPGELLSDNGLCFTGRLHHTVVSFERQIAQAGVRFPHSRPYHPQTCGKVERQHGTQNAWLARHDPPTDLPAAQQLLDAYRQHYNTARPHQALNGDVPAQRYHPGQGVLLPVIDLEPADHNPPGCLRRKINAQGAFTYARRSFYLGDRWAGVTVGTLRNNAHLQVYYGHSLIDTFLVDTQLPTPTR